MQSHFRPTAAYTASVVLIEATQPARSPLPVLSRGRVDPATGRDGGVVVNPGLVPPLPTLTAVVPPAHQPVAPHRRHGRSARPRPRGHRPRSAARQRPLRDRHARSPRSRPRWPRADALIQFTLRGQPGRESAGGRLTACQRTARATRRKATLARPHRAAIGWRRSMTNLPLGLRASSRRTG